MKKKLGILGGLGPAASAWFMELLTAATLASRDQEHLDAILLSYASIPDRTAFITGAAPDSPLPHLQQALATLAGLGVANIAIPCVTSHVFFDQLQASCPVPILNLPKLTAASLRAAGYRRAGIAATTGTLSSQLFQTALVAADLDYVVPELSYQEQIMAVIYDQVKCGAPINQAMWLGICDYLRSRDCDCVILGCTELSLVARQLSGFEHAEQDQAPASHGAHAAPGLPATVPLPQVDALAVLAVRAIEASGAAVRPAYQLP